MPSTTTDVDIVHQGREIRITKCDTSLACCIFFFMRFASVVASGVCSLCHKQGRKGGIPHLPVSQVQGCCKSLSGAHVLWAVGVSDVRCHARVLSIQLPHSC